MADLSAILIAARDEEGRIGATVRALRERFPGAEVIVGDDGSKDGTAEEAQSAGARVVRLRHRGKGACLTLAERTAPDGRLLLCDADLTGDLQPLVDADADLVIAAFAERHGGGFGIVKRTARALIRLASGYEAVEPISGQRVLSPEARRRVFPLTPGFAGCEARMTVDAVRAGLRVVEVEIALRHRETGRDLSGFLHRGRQFVHLLLAFGPTATNHRGLRLPIAGWMVGARHPRVGAIAAIGLADDLWSGPERGFRNHLGAGATTGILKLVGIPLVGLLATRKVSGALLVGLAANFLNQLDTKPGRALKAYLAGALVVGAPLGSAVLLLPYDLREKVMLGDAGSNALGAMLGLSSVSRLTGSSRWLAIGALAGLTLLGERRSLGELIERTPVLRTIDSLGREP